MIATTPVFCAFLLSLLTASPSHGYSSSSRQQNRRAPATAAAEVNTQNGNNDMMLSRRGVLRALSTVAVGTVVAQPTKGAMAAEGDVDVPVYFGVGYVHDLAVFICFLCTVRQYRDQLTHL